DIFIDPLSRLYPLTKKICTVALAFDGEFVFNRHMVYESMVRKFPDLEENLMELYRLRPFAVAWKTNGKAPLPFSPLSCANEVARLRNLLKQIVARVEQDEPWIRSTRPV